MGLFGSGKQEQTEPVRREQVLLLINLGMRETDAGDRCLHDDEPTPEFRAAQDAFNAELGRSTTEEKTQAFDALNRHGY